MELYEALVKVTRRLSLPWGHTVIAPIGDVQFGAEACDVKRFRRWVALNASKGTYFLGMGDLVDVASPSNRSRIKAAELYDSVQDALEWAAEDTYRRLMNILKDTKGMWLGLLEGHHFWEFRDGSTTDTRIAEELGAPFLGDCAFVRLAFSYDKAQTHRLGYTIWCHHGVGSGMRAAAPLNRVEMIANTFDADIYLIGHHHKQVAAKFDQVYMTRTEPYRLDHREKVIACTGGWLRGYLLNNKQGVGRPGGTYVEQRMLPTAALGGIRIYLNTMKGNAVDWIEQRVEI